MSKSGQRRTCARSRQKLPRVKAQLVQIEWPASDAPLRCRPGDLALVVRTRPHMPFTRPGEMDFLLGRFVRVEYLAPNMPLQCGVWILSERIHENGFVTNGLPDAWLQPLHPRRDDDEPPRPEENPHGVEAATGDKQ